ncbi:MAG: ATP-binding protein [Desulfobacterales bacterium]|nr:ATP-binding protein [Desulfobacterales bacterium]
MDVRIKTLRLKNFKGIESFTLDANGSDVTIFGDNGTGKTTIFDAFTWLLYDKDSLNSAQFDIKPLNGLGEAQHGNEHSVEGVLEINE